MREKNLGINKRLESHHREQRRSSVLVPGSTTIHAFFIKLVSVGKKKKGSRTTSLRTLDLLSNLDSHHQEANGGNVT